MNNKELLMDFLKFHYKENPHRRELTNEKDVEDYLRQQNLQQCNVSGSLPYHSCIILGSVECTCPADKCFRSKDGNNG